MYREVPTQDYPNGYFSSHQKCCLGGQIFEWLIAQATHEHKKARHYCQQMLDKHIIKNVDKKS